MRKKKQTKELQINGERNARSINFVGITLKNIGRNKFKIHEKYIYISVSTRGYQVVFRGMDVLNRPRRGFLSCSVGSGFKIWMISCETIGLWLTLKS